MQISAIEEVVFEIIVITIAITIAMHMEIPTYVYTAILLTQFVSF